MTDVLTDWKCNKNTAFILFESKLQSRYCKNNVVNLTNYVQPSFIAKSHHAKLGGIDAANLMIRAISSWRVRSVLQDGH